MSADSTPNFKPYSYIDAGFNGFFRRTLASNPSASTLNQRDTMNRRDQGLNMDQRQVTGFLGDVLQVGSITIDGKTGTVKGFDDNKNEVWRWGPLDV